MGGRQWELFSLCLWFYLTVNDVGEMLPVLELHDIYSFILSLDKKIINIKKLNCYRQYSPRIFLEYILEWKY